jgi:glutamate synthase (NADPH/NADH) large chain
VAYVREWGQLNPDSVCVRPVPREDVETLRALIEEHRARTGSRLAADLLADWPAALRGFRQVIPVAVPPATHAPAPAPAPDEPATEETTARA